MLAWGPDNMAVPTPFGATIDALNAAPHGMAVDLALAALYPLSRLWDVARDGLQRLDRWFVGPVFALDRVDVAHKLSSMRRAVEHCGAVFGRPLPLLVDTLRVLTVAGGAASAAPSAARVPHEDGVSTGNATTAHTDDSGSEMSESAIIASIAASFGIPKHVIKAPTAARAIARAVDTKIASFEKRQFPLIKVLCNPHLQVIEGGRFRLLFVFTPFLFGIACHSRDTGKQST